MEYEPRKVRVELEIEVDMPKGVDDDDLNWRLNYNYCVSNYALDYLVEYDKKHGGICNLLRGAHVISKECGNDEVCRQ